MPVTSGLAEATVKRWQPRTRTWRNSVFISFPGDGDVEVWWGPQWRRVCLFAMFDAATYSPIWGWKTPVSQNHESYDIQSVLYQSWKDIILCRPFNDTMSSYGSRVNISLTAQQILKYYGNSKSKKWRHFFRPCLFLFSGSTMLERHTASVERSICLYLSAWSTHFF